MDDLEPCPGCGVKLPRTDREGHPYVGASASCWAVYGEILAREYADPLYMRAHRLTVDAYAAQHPGTPERRSIQSVWVHLAGLYLTLEKDCSPRFVRRVIGSLTGVSHRLPWLEPPVGYGLTVADVLDARDAPMHADLVLRWAQNVWVGWRTHQTSIRTLVDTRLSQL